MVKSAVKVAIRTRPSANFASDNLHIDVDTGVINITIPKDEKWGSLNNQQDSWKFKQEQILHNQSQEGVFNECKDIISGSFEGYNGTILTQGQTGAGKTFTITGGSQNYKYRGIIPRALAWLQQEVTAKPENAITIHLSQLEIYNETMFDLLTAQEGISQNLTILDDPKGGIVIKGLTKHCCQNEEDAMNCLFEGETNRTIGSHVLNKVSSRSHCVLTVQLEIRSKVESSEKIVVSKLNFVDLAGSERTKKTGSEGILLKEATYINKSLSYLEQVVVALCDKNRDHVPQRQSKLTNMLKDSIGGNSRTMMIANIWPEPQHIEETVSTLRFAQRMARVSNEVGVNMHLDPRLLLKKQEKEIKDLRQELSMHDTLANRHRINYEPQTMEQQNEQKELATKFLENEEENIDFESLRQVRELFTQMKVVQSKLKDKTHLQNVNVRPDTKENKNIKDSNETQEKDDQNQVGDDDNNTGFGLGKANPNSRPEYQKEEENTSQSPIRGNLKSNPISPNDKSGLKDYNYDSMQMMDRQTCFTNWKLDLGHDISQTLDTNKTELKTKKKKIKELSDKCKSLTVEIEETKKELEHIKDTKKQDDDVIDEEEYNLIKKIKEAKKEYRSNYDEIKQNKTELIKIQKQIDSNKQKMALEFEKQWDENYGGMEETILKDNSNLIDDKDEKDDIKEEVKDIEDPDTTAQFRAKKTVNILHKGKPKNARKK